MLCGFFFSSRRRHTRFDCDWSSDVCSSDLEESKDDPARRVARLGLALAAVLLGFGLAAIQLLPFIQYIPFSPRAQGYHGFEGSTSWAIPWNHVPEFFLKNFVGSRDTYWGSNFAKLHSEYLGLPVIALAALGAGAKDRRRLVLWVGGIGLLFLLVSLGAATPFYKLWWALMPMVKKTRAPGDRKSTRLNSSHSQISYAVF